MTNPQSRKTLIKYTLLFYAIYVLYFTLFGSINEGIQYYIFPFICIIVLSQIWTLPDRLYVYLGLSISLAPFINTLPVIRLTLSQLILISLLLHRLIHHGVPTSKHTMRVLAFLLPILLLAIISNSGIGYYQLLRALTFASIPILMLINIPYLVRTEEDSFTVILMAIYAFIFIIFASAYGYYIVGKAELIPSSSIFRLGLIVDYGIIEYNLYATTIGILSSALFPLVIIFHFDNVESSHKYLFISIAFICFLAPFLGIMRGGIAGLLIATILLWLFYVSREGSRLKYKTLGLSVFLILGVFFSIRYIINHILDDASVQYIINVTDIYSYNTEYRVDLLRDAVMRNSLYSGIGFDRALLLSGDDEVNLYSWVLNGVGILGGILFMLVYTQILVSLLKSYIAYRKSLLALGFIFLMAVLVASNANSTFFAFSYFYLPFCAIVFTTYNYVRLHPYLIKSNPKDQRLRIYKGSI
jgi:hypothetical protein